jgi:hypothetical protein
MVSWTRQTERVTTLYRKLLVSVSRLKRDEMKNVRGSHQQQYHQTQARPKRHVGLKIQLKRESGDVDVEKSIDGIMRNQRGSEQVWVLGCIGPTTGILGKNIPRVRNDGAGENG